MAGNLHPRQRVVQPQDESIRYIPLTQGKVAIVDAEDYEDLARFNWHAFQTKRICYARRQSKLPNGKQSPVMMHRQIMGFPDEQVDHWDHNGLNCRKSNLRVATPSTNGANRQIGDNNKSGFKGVFLHGRDQKYVATIVVNGKRQYHGYHGTAELAARAYDEAAKEAFGEFALLNFPEGGCQIGSR